MDSLYYAAACQTNFPAPTSTGEIADRTRRMCEIAEQTVVGYEPFHDVRLLAFPEFAHAVPIHDTVAKLRRHLGVPVPNEHTDRYERLAREYGCYIQTGSFLEAPEGLPDVVFNTTVLVGPGGVLATYRKVNPWIPWEVHASPHDVPGYDEDLYPVVETELGRLAVATCYDWLFPETLRELAFRGAEVLIRISAYMDPWGTAEPTSWWTLVNRTRALENTACVVAVNQGAEMTNYPPFSWPGGSMIVDHDGRILAQADPGPGEKVVVAPVDVRRIREERERRMGHDMLGHLRTDTLTYTRQPGLAPASGHPISIDSLKQRIRSSRETLAAWQKRAPRDGEGSL